MAQSLILLDIDGTLLNENKKVPTSAGHAVKKLQKAGHIVAFATGRAPFTFQNVQQTLQITTYVSLNGQYVVHNGHVIYHNPMQANVFDALESYATTQHHPIVYLGHHHWSSNIGKYPHIQQAFASFDKDHNAIYDPQFHGSGNVYQARLFCRDEALYVEMFPNLAFIRWQDTSVDVVPAKGSKAAGIQRLQAHLGVSSDDVYAFGDGLNDITMLESVQHSVAMGNAPDVVKKAAGIVTSDVNNDGLWHGLHMVGLI